MGVSNSDDIIDSREVVDRIEELKYSNDKDDIEELRILEELADEASSNCNEWGEGAQLIRDSYFTEYAREFVQDMGDLPSSLPSYIENNIDWDGVANDIQDDFSSVNFDGVEYWIR